jgi:hypothetical protein
MQTMTRESWTDERMDDLSTRVDRGFDRVDADIREQRAETREGFDRIDARFDALNRRIYAFAGALIVALAMAQL